MNKTFRSKSSATSALFVKGFKRVRDGVWEKDGIVAMIHPIPGTMAVRVSYAEAAR